MWATGHKSLLGRLVGGACLFMAERLWESEIGTPREFTNVQTIRCSRRRMMNRTLSVTARSCVQCRSVNRGGVGGGTAAKQLHTQVKCWHEYINYPMIMSSRSRYDLWSGSGVTCFMTVAIGKRQINGTERFARHRHSSRLVNILFLNSFSFCLSFFFFVGGDQYVVFCCLNKVFNRLLQL